MRIFAALGALFLAAGCAALTDRALNRIEGADPGVDTDEMNRLQAEGAARMILRIAKFDHAVTLLEAGARDGVRRWRGTDNAQIYTKDGIIIATRGLGLEDLMSADTGGAAGAITRAAASGAGAQITRIHRLPDGEERLAIRSYICDVTPGQPERIRVGETQWIMATQVTETCHSPGGGFLNRHWVAHGQIVQSIQNFAPEAGSLDILFLP